MSAYTSAERLLAAMELETNDTETMRRLGALIVRVSNLIDTILGFSFGGQAVVAFLDGPGDAKLWLPAPGAVSVLTVVEDGVTLAAPSYEHEPSKGRYLTRLDASNRATWWTANPRGIAVTYAPNPHPPGVEEVCIEECVRRWQGQAAGYPDVVGVQGSNERRYTRAFAPGTLETLAGVRSQYGVRNLVAV